MKKPIYRKTIRVPIYDYKFDIIWCEDHEALQKIFPDKEFPPEMDAGVLRTDGYAHMTFISADKPSPAIIGHESKHIVNDLFLYVGQELDRQNDEAECYLLTWIVAEVCKFFEKKK